MSKNATCIPTTIYALCDPTTGEVRYIGKTVWPRRRIADHMAEMRRGDHTHRGNWLRSLVARPIFRTLSVIDDRDALEHERRVIAAYKKIGIRLTNNTEGGEGTLGCTKSPETRAKISAAKRAQRKHLTPEHKAMISAVHRGKVVSAEIRARMADGRRGMKFSPEHVESMSRCKRGKPWTKARRDAQERVA